MKPKNIAVVYLEPYEKQEKETFDLVINILNENKIKFDLIKRNELKENKLKNSDLVIVIGGDGTFLRASHFIENQLVLGVNCTPNFREGFFLKSNLTNFKENFKKLLTDDFKIIELNRISAVINGKETTLALNEIFIGTEKSYKTFIYKIKVDGKQEMQKSSGVLIATAAGSNAWAKSAGGTALDIGSDSIQYLIREPYEGKLTKPKLLKGIVEDIEIQSLTDKAIVVIDSTSKEYNFSKGKTLKIKKGEVLRFIEF